MNVSFGTLCMMVIALTLLASYGLAPLFWDAAGYVNDILNSVYHVDFSVEVR